MKNVFILNCSPHANGVCERLAEYFISGLGEETLPFKRFNLRDYYITPCNGCQACQNSLAKCRYSDHFNYLLSLLENSSLAVFISPVYYYALPAICAAFIDRGQALWNKNIRNKYPPAIIILAAGRKQGNKLFTGASLSFYYFFKTLGSNILSRYAFKGLENTEQLQANSSIKEFLYTRGKSWAKFIALNEKL